MTGLFQTYLLTLYLTLLTHILYDVHFERARGVIVNVYSFQNHVIIYVELSFTPRGFSKFLLYNATSASFFKILPFLTLISSISNTLYIYKKTRTVSP